ncbi:MAG: zinc ribbon domain-containing protein [Verrucomicrobia bacterium]|nr:zinc ribbon domain-containing protein [Verrucomicrobiota bacterium]
MPTYEYKCEKCNRTFETFQSMKDEPLVVCPQNLCRQEVWGHGKVKRLIGTGAGLIFKGSGFYTTDYRSSDYKESAKKEGESSKGEAKGGADKPKEGGSPSTGDGVKSEAPKSDGAKGGAEKATGSSGTAASKES